MDLTFGLFVTAVVAFFTLVVGLQWFFHRERWRTLQQASVGEGAYRSQTRTMFNAPVFPKRVAMLAMLTNLWGVLTLLFAVAGGLLIAISSDGHNVSQTLVALVCVDGLVLGIASFVVASRLMRRTDRAVTSARSYSVFSALHHVAVLLIFAIGAREYFALTVIPCAVGLCLAPFMYWGAHAMRDDAPLMHA